LLLQGLDQRHLALDSLRKDTESKFEIEKGGFRTHVLNASPLPKRFEWISNHAALTPAPILYIDEI
jgi:hypothetical protein